MAGDWIKMRTHLASERATMVICDLTGLDEFAVVGRLHAIWVWAGEHTITGDVTGVTVKTVDRVTRCENFGSAMVSAGWLETLPDGGLRFPRWRRHNSKAAKERLLAAERQARKRAKSHAAKRDAERDASVTSHAPREEKTRGDDRKNRSSKGDRKSIGSADAERGDTRSAARRQSPWSPNEISSDDEMQPEPFDLSMVDWSHAVAMAEAAARHVPPITEKDRRAWLKFGVLADVTFSESWIADAAQAVARATETKRTKQAHFVAVLKNKAAEQHGVDEPTFTAMCRRIEIPTDVWKSPVLEVRK